MADKQPRPDTRFNLGRRGHFEGGAFQSHPDVQPTGRTVTGIKLVDTQTNAEGGTDYVPLFSRDRKDPEPYHPGSEVVARDRTDLAEGAGVGDPRSPRAGIHFIATGIRNDATGQMEEEYPVNINHLTNRAGELRNPQGKPRAILNVEAPEHVTELQNKQNSKWALAGRVNIGQPMRASKLHPLLSAAQMAKKKAK